MRSWILLLCVAGVVTIESPRARAAEPPAPGAPAKTGSTPNVLRSGLWRQWVLWSRPGPAAKASLERTLNLINVTRASKGGTPLKPALDSRLIFSVITERDPRGPDGTALKDGNLEMFFATFVEDEAGKSFVLFLDDPLRSNAELAKTGLPGTVATITGGYVEVVDATSTFSTKWTAKSLKDEVEFEASYSATTSTERRSFPAAAEFVSGSIAHNLDMLYASRPTESIELWERSSSTWVSLPGKGAKAKLKVKLHDPELHAMFSDPLNLPIQLVQIERQVRIQK